MKFLINCLAVFGFVIAIGVASWAGYTPFPLDWTSGSWVSADSQLRLKMVDEIHGGRDSKTIFILDGASKPVASGAVQRILPNGIIVARIIDLNQSVWSAVIWLDEAQVMHLHLGNDSMQIETVLIHQGD